MPGLRTDGCDYEQGDCKESEAAHGMNPLMDDTEPVSTEFRILQVKNRPDAVCKSHLKSEMALCGFGWGEDD